MTADDLRTALQGGKSLADVAKDKGVDVAKVVDALVADLKAHLDAEVKARRAHPGPGRPDAGRLPGPASQAFVNGKAPAGGPGSVRRARRSSAARVMVVRAVPAGPRRRLRRLRHVGHHHVLSGH